MPWADASARTRPLPKSNSGNPSRLTRQPEAGVDSRLTAPSVDRLLAHFEFYRDLGNLSAAFNQIYDSSPKLRRAAHSCHHELPEKA